MPACVSARNEHTGAADTLSGDTRGSWMLALGLSFGGGWLGMRGLHSGET